MQGALGFPLGNPLQLEECGSLTTKNRCPAPGSRVPQRFFCSLCIPTSLPLRLPKRKDLRLLKKDCHPVLKRDPGKRRKTWVPCPRIGVRGRLHTG